MRWQSSSRIRTVGCIIVCLIWRGACCQHCYWAVYHGRWGFSWKLHGHMTPSFPMPPTLSSLTAPAGALPLLLAGGLVAFCNFVSLFHNFFFSFNSSVMDLQYYISFGCTTVIPYFLHGKMVSTVSLVTACHCTKLFWYSLLYFSYCTLHACDSFYNWKSAPLDLLPHFTHPPLPPPTPGNHWFVVLCIYGSVSLLFSF